MGEIEMDGPYPDPEAAAEIIRKAEAVLSEEALRLEGIEPPLPRRMSRRGRHWGEDDPPLHAK